MQNIKNKLTEDDIKFVSLQFSDLLGVVKEVIISKERLLDSLENGVWFDGSSIEGFSRIQESDLFLKPDLNTYAVIPWTSLDKKTARFICDIYTPNGELFPGYPRTILKKILNKAKQKGYAYKVGPELEFFLFKKNGFNPEILDNEGYFDLCNEKQDSILKEICNYLKNFKIDFETIHHEVAKSQYEIDFKYGDALDIADKLMTLKFVVKKVAQKHDLYASFMPKPILKVNGSGMHVHQSLFDLSKNENVFFEKNDPYSLSNIAYNFISGQMEDVLSFCAILAPTVNSYKRLVQGFEAPVYVSWASQNRSALFRIPKWAVNSPSSARVEIRCPDPCANPYLAFAILLNAGLNGIEKNLKITEPVEENIYDLNLEKLKEKKLKTLPRNLFEALLFFKKNQLVKETLGDDLFEKYFRIKLNEWESYQKQINDVITHWEIKKYF